MKGIFKVATALACIGARPDQELTWEHIFPNATYPGAIDHSIEAELRFGQKSDPFYPSPWMSPGVVGWEEAYLKAKDFVSQLTLVEKVNLTTGTGYVSCD